MASKKVAPEDRKPLGRPPLWDQMNVDLDMVMNYCLLGAKNQDLARFLGVSVSTIDVWLKEIPEFSGAVKAGREDADANVGKSLYHRACGYSTKETRVLNIDGEVVEVEVNKNYPPDSMALSFWLRNRRPDLWREKQDLNLTSDKDVAELLAQKRKEREGG